MSHIVETNRADGVWKILWRGSLLSILMGTFLFYVVPVLAIRFLPLAGIFIH